MFSWTGREIGDFVIEELIGRGGMAAVYAAQQRSVERQVALKIIDLQEADGTDFLQRFAREAEVIAMLEHIHILPIYGYGLLEGEFAYFAMRLLRHGTLADVLRNGALPLDDAVDLFTQIASGLDYMHNQGVIHRDLKPSNILLDEEGNAYLSDFGLARLTGATINRADDSLGVEGSPAYIAPEVIQGERADHLSDIYSLGVILYQMLCGRVPFASEEGGVSALLYKHMREKPPSLRQFNPAISPEVEAVVLRALSKNPRARYPSAEEMAYDLRDAMLPSGFKVSQLPRMTSELVRQKLRSRRLLYLLLALLCALIALLGFLLLRSHAGGPPMNVRAGEHAGLGDLALSNWEIDLARARLGTGFIAYFPCTLANVYQTAMTREVNDIARSDNLGLRTYDSHDDPSREATLIEQARIDGAKAFVLCPLGEPLLDDSILSLQQAAIPLVLTYAYDLPYGIKIDMDDAAIGAEQGRYAGQILQSEHGGSGTVVLLTMQGTAHGRDRVQGMTSGLRASAPNAQVIGPLSGYTRAQAAASLGSLIASGTHFDAVLTISDAAALGAIDALKAANLTPKDVFIVSANGEDPVTSDIQDGYYVRGTVALNHSEQAQLAIIGIVKALAGSPVPEHLTLNTGTFITAETAQPGT